MSVVGIIVIIIIAELLFLTVFSLIAINYPRTKEEEDLRFKQDCEEFDKYIADKREK